MNILNQRLYCDWCDATVKKVRKILMQSSEMPTFEYISEKRVYHSLFNREECLFCGKWVNYPETGHFMQEGNFPYVICDECYNLTFS